MKQNGSPRLDWIVFDLGAVLIDWNPRYLYRRLTSDDAKIETFLREIATSDWNSRLDAGAPFAATIAARAIEHPTWREWLEHWHLDWPSMLHGPIDETVRIFETVVSERKAGRLKGVFALSNWEANTFKIAKARFPFLDGFDGRLISGEEKLIKPDPRFFQLLSERYGVEPAHALFVDDVEKNIAAAAALGFQTHWFRNPDDLATDLAQRGLLRAKERA